MSAVAGSAVAGPSERLMRGGSSARRIVIWRHGQTTHNAAGIWQGQFDAPLSEAGVEQARAAAPAVAAYAPSLVVASPLQRAARTAAAAAGHLDLPVETDSRLQEINVGEWSGLTTTEVADRWPTEHKQLEQGIDIRRGETGETVAEVAARGLAALNDVIARLEPAQTALLVTHGVAGRAMAAALVGIEQQVAWLALAGLGNCHWAVLGEGRRGWRIEEWNAHT